MGDELVEVGDEVDHGTIEHQQVVGNRREVRDQTICASVQVDRVDGRIDEPEVTEIGEVIGTAHSTHRIHDVELDRDGHASRLRCTLEERPVETLTPDAFAERR